MGLFCFILSTMPFLFTRTLLQQRLYPCLELFGIKEATDSTLWDFFAVLIKEDDRRQTDNIQLLHQSAVLRAVAGQIGTQQFHLGELLLHLWIAERIFFKLFARYAPVRI